MDRATALRLAARAVQEQRTAEREGRPRAANNARIRALTYRAIAARAVAGRARSRGGSGLAEERARRIADAAAQPRTPVTHERFFFKTLHRTPRPKRRPLDEESRRYYEDRYSDLGYGIDALKTTIYGLRKEIEQDKYDRGGKVDYRHYAKGKKAFTPTGRRIKLRPELAFDTAQRAADKRLRELNAELRVARAEQKEIDDVMRHGELPGHYRKRLAARRRR
jgi:hypothetical protein